MERLLAQFDRLVIFDTETTGLRFQLDEIIEFAAAVVELKDGKAQVTEEYDNLVKLSPGVQLPAEIQKLTGITPQDLSQRGIEKNQLCADMSRLFSGDRTLLLAYNAHFDLCFLYNTLKRFGDPGILRGKAKIDLLTVYRDRRGYPHRLASAIEAYNLQDRVQNSHRAIDDVLATVAVMQEMMAERPDILRYIDLFGYNAKYGIGSKPIGSVTYLPQGYEPGLPIYEKLEQHMGRG